MAEVRATVVNKSRIVVHVPRDIPVRDLQTWGEDIAELVEERIAQDFERERAAGRALKGNTEAHEQRKARDGWLMTKGHMSGDLQAELDAGGFADVRARSGRLDIIWTENALRGRIEHAEYYAESKVAGGRILVTLQKDARTAEKYIKDRIQDLTAAA